MSSLEEDAEGFAVAFVREDRKWACGFLPRAAFLELTEAERELRNLNRSGEAFALIDIDDEFFVVIRVDASGTRLLLSDATAAIDYDLAAEVLERLGVAIPDIDPDELDDIEPWPEGDVEMLADLGLNGASLSNILRKVDLYPDELLGLVAKRVGCGPELALLLARNEPPGS